MGSTNIIRDDTEPIAIVGTACRFSGSLNNPSKLWEFLREPKDVLSKIHKERFNADAYYHPNGLHHGTSNVTESYLLQEDIRLFDSNFFNIKPIEAQAIDPQQRLLLEVVYESLEAAGMSMEKMAGSETGVYVGLMCGDYSEHIQRDIDSLPTYMATGTARSIISNRISYFFDWHGPSMTIDTACSSSLVAVHQAAQLLRSGDSDMAVAAGANLILGPELYIGEAKLNMLSPTGRSRMWDADADGYARGEGVASVVLKRLSDAIRDGDHIECVIRESGVNSDGRTKGITMPNEAAQAELIRRVYSKAGLNPLNETQRCQFFEAHGTGTIAGDGREAAGISQAFFPSTASKQTHPLYVGSIKTTLGHTEGTAGLAGLIKSSLALQNATIPPNLLFNRLSPSVEPFYGRLQIAKTPLPWPKVEGPRRASVNSFGFGGTNAHVILESFVSTGVNNTTNSRRTPSIPFVFSAASENALTGALESYSAYLKCNPAVDLVDLAYTLSSRRSVLSYRASFSATTAEELEVKINERLAKDKDNNDPTTLANRPDGSAARILGVFTGQGAQWAGMGRELVRDFKYARGILEELEATLSTLPNVAHRPSWSLTKEVLAGSTESRVGEARISQPLCTAIQILLVDLLRLAGLNFTAVVGHSSGEIGAAYAAGFISRSDAIKIAYYRGLCAEQAPHPGQTGAMMAVGTTFEDATEVCGLEAFEGRICVAACNSPSSITLSGDVDAIDEVKAVFDDEKKFARKLKVDKAYHSHHMEACASSYLEVLHACLADPKPAIGHDSGSPPAHWYSSVQSGCRIAHGDENLSGQYWVDNMLQPVLLSRAIESAVEYDGLFNLVIEVGPHPALKGPVQETLQSLVENAPPPTYIGTLQRGHNDTSSFADALGSIWTRFNGVLDLNSYDLSVSDLDDKVRRKRRVIPSLPTYKWDHGRPYWHDSRASRAFRNRTDPPNALLGSRVVDGIADGVMRWRNMIKPSQLRWIQGHQLQGQMVYPAAAYISTAVEAAPFVARAQALKLIEISDFTIGKALTFEQEQSTAETLFVVSDIIRDDAEGTISAVFQFNASLNPSSDELTCLATGRLHLTLASAEDVLSEKLPGRTPEPPVLADVHEDQFYSSLSALGYQYTGEFRGLVNLRRKMNYGQASVNIPLQNEAADAVLVHPALLDVAFQAIFLAYWWPNDGSLDQLHVPTSIARIRIDPSEFVLIAAPDAPATLGLESHLTDDPLKTSGIRGDVDIFGCDGDRVIVQIEGVRVTAFSERSSQNDRQLFSEHVWGPALPDGSLAANNRATDQDFELARDLERLSIYFMKHLEEQIPVHERAGMNLEWHHEALFEFTNHILTQTRNGKQRFADPAWLNDSWEDIVSIVDRYPDSIEIRLNKTVGENLPAAVRGETQILQHMFKDNLLNRYYTEAMGLREATDFLARTVAQLVHRYPHMNMLEIGAGTGGATKAIMRDINHTTFSSYTFTDISTGFFETAMGVFDKSADKMIFKALDAEKDIVEQGYKEYSYDVVIASLVLHATKSLEATLSNTRRLLKPGGYLIMLEITNNDVLRVGFAMSGLPGWWLGKQEGRRFSPCVSSMEWHDALLKSGFSGIDTLTPEVDVLCRPLSVIVSQAVNEQMAIVRQPFSNPDAFHTPDVADDSSLVIIGGSSLTTSVLIDEILKSLSNFDLSVIRFSHLGEVDASLISPAALILSVTELDHPVFQDLTSEAMQGLKSVFEYHQRTVLWVTRGCRADEPYMNMTVGLGRTLALENPDLRLQFLDLDVAKRPDAKLITETLLRLRMVNIEADHTLWTREQEMYQEGDRMIIPRLVPISESNQRYNASKRSITTLRDSGSSTIELSKSHQDETYRLAEVDLHNVITVPGSVTIQVMKSTLDSIGGAMYGVFGSDPSTGDKVLGLLPRLSSQASLSPSHLIRCNMENIDSPGVEARLLIWLEIEIQADAILRSLRRGSTAILVQPDPLLVHVLGGRRGHKNISLFYAASSPPQIPSGDSTSSWITLHRSLPQRALKALLPPDVSAVISCKEDKSGDLISACLPSGIWKTALGPLVRSTDLDVKSVLERTLGRTTDLLQPKYHILNPTAVVSGTDSRLKNTIIDWQVEPSLPVQLTSVDSAISFGSNKTYVLFGLTSDLGLSLCDWMVSHGARNIVLTSRHPQVDQRWLDLKKESGVRIEVISNDITGKASVERLVQTIRHEWPPIAGVMHGAMVLQDTAFSEMSHETMTKVLRPKVLGAIYLDQLFQHDHPLDFLIFFSSLASASGNRGQSNYSAANMFMTAKTFERRRKGLAASVLHIGAVMGVGYVMREVSETVFPAIRRAGFMWMEERGFHQCIAESILAGRPGSDRNPEIVTGLRLVNAKEEEPTPWMNNPRFQHCINWGDVAGLEGPRHAGTAAIATKQALQQASNSEEVARIVEESVIAKFQIALQLPAVEDERARAALLGSDADDLGVDSLVAVEIRSWFLKELDIEMPVLKILGGATIQDMVTFAIEKVSAEKQVTPSLDATVLSTDTATVQEPEAGSIVEARKIDVDGQYSSGVSTGSSSSLTPASPVSESAQTRALPESSLTSISSTTATSDAGDATSQGKLTLADTEPRSLQEIEVVKRVPLSFGQSRFWFLRRYVEDQTTFNITFSVKLKGPLRADALGSAVEKVGARHEALRTAFTEKDEGGPVMQSVLSRSHLALEKKQVANVEQVDEIFQSVKDHAYNIEVGDCMRVLLLNFADPDTNYLIIGYHHINMDGASLEVFLADLERAYMGRPFVPQVPLQYPDYAEKQRRDVESGRLKEHIAYWRKELLSPVPAPVLPLLPSSRTRERQPLQNYDHERVDRRIDSPLAKQIQQVCSQQKANAFHFYMAIFRMTLYRLLGTSDICLGMADANRFEGSLSTSMGMYLNLLPVRLDLGHDRVSFPEVLKQTRKKVYGALANSALPFDLLLDELKIPRSTHQSPLFQAFINYRSGVAEKRTLGAVEGEGEEYQFGRTGYDISIDIMDDPGRTPLLMFNGQKGLYSLQDTEVFADGFVQTLEYYSGNPTATIGSAPTLRGATEASESIAQSISRGIDAQSAWPETVVHQIDKWVSSQPEASALNDTNGDMWTYGYMGERIDHIALALMDLGVRPGSRVCVFQEPCLDWACALVAVLRLGAVYVALDVQLPTARLSNLVEQCEPSALVVHDATASLAPALIQGWPQVSLLNLSTTATTTTTKAKLPIVATAKSAACILFTSGTTGKPKGVVLSHENLQNHVEWGQVQGPEIVLQQSACSFDLALEQVLLALVYGGTLVVVPRELRGDPVGITKVMLREGVTWTGATPSEYSSWIQYSFDNLRQCPKWKLAVSVGEEMPQAVVKAFGALGLESLQVWNSYGPCETTLGTTATEIQVINGGVPQSISVGKTLANRAVYILDNELKPVPTGTVGEVVIGGAGVAIGYLGNETQTAATFLPDPLATASYRRNGWTRMYRTGDRGRLSPETGHLELAGRIDGDSQVKIHGARVELQEVEATIQRLAQDRVTAVAVTARGGKRSASPFLVAHVVLAPGVASDTDLGVLKRLLSDEWPLPRYMNPSVVIPVTSLPHTTSGKLDRKAVGALPISNGSQQATVAAQLSDMEHQLRSVWEEVLSSSTPASESVQDVHHIDGGSDFFHVGGNSMLLISLQALIQKRFGAKLTVMRLFERSTLSSMAAEIHDATSALDTEIDWAAETAIGKDLVDAGNFNIASLEEKVKDAASGLVVILTGATGFLGMEMLSQLVASPRVAKVHAIAVRSPSKLGSLADSPKVLVHAGELTQDRVGLSPDTAREIFSRSHVLIHSGSDVSFLKTYQTLRVPNVEGTRELVRLALEHGVPFHYISTAVTGRLNQQDSFGEVSLRGSAPPPGWQDGYIASKWVAEVLLERVHDELGLPVWIHRPSSITGDGASDTDVMNSVVKFARLLRAVPVSSRWRGMLDFISLEKSAQGILGAVLAEPGTGLLQASGPIKHLHHSGELLIPVDGLRQHLEMEDKREYRELSLEDWVAQAVEQGLNVLIAAYLAAIDELKLDIVFQKLG